MKRTYQRVTYKGRPHTRIWINGESTISPCNNTRCQSRHCRSGQAENISTAVKGIALDFRYSTLLTFNRASRDEAEAAIRHITKRREELFGPGTKTLGVIEKHKSSWQHPNNPTGYHAHVLVLHNKKRRLRAKIKPDGTRYAHMQTLNLDNPESWETFNPSYLLKEHVRDSQQHRDLNGGRLYFASDGFFSNEATKGSRDKRKAAAAYYRYMTDVRKKVCAALRANCGRDKTEDYRETRAEQIWFSRLRYKHPNEIFRLAFLYIAYARRFDRFDRRGKEKIYRCMNSVATTIFKHEQLVWCFRAYHSPTLYRRLFERLIERYFLVPNYIQSTHPPFPGFEHAKNLS